MLSSIFRKVLKESQLEEGCHASNDGRQCCNKLKLGAPKGCCSCVGLPDSMCDHATQAVYFETTAAGGVSWEEVEESRLRGEGAGSSSGQQSRKKLKISIPRWCGKWVVSMDEYKDGVVGAKSKNLAGAACHPVLGLQGLTDPELALPCRT